MLNCEKELSRFLDRDRRYEFIPRHMAENLRDYARYGKHLDNFLRSVVANDLRGTCRHLSRFSEEEIPEDVRSKMLRGLSLFCTNFIPASYYGSRDAYHHCVDEGGVYGKQESPVYE